MEVLVGGNGPNSTSSSLLTCAVYVAAPQLVLVYKVGTVRTLQWSCCL